MTHPAEKELIAHLHGDASAESSRHIAECADCTQSIALLRRVLAAVDSLPIPDPGPDYPARVWENLDLFDEELTEDPDLRRVLDIIDAASVPDPGSGFEQRVWQSLNLPARRKRNHRRWLAPLSIAAMLCLAFLAGRHWPDRAAKPTVAALHDNSEAVLLLAVSDHLERSQLILVELANAHPVASFDLQSEKARAEDLVADNRLYRQTAMTAGENGLASLLEELERVLLEIAHSPNDATRADLERIRRRMQDEGILFKIRVTGSNLQSRETPQEKL